MAWNKPARDTEDSPSTAAPERTAPRGQTARFGASLVLEGTLTGEEDLMVEGRLDGRISLKKHRATIGTSGRVTADVFAKSICVEGEVDGNLFGEDEVVIRRTGKVHGNVTAPRVTLEDGAKFRGSVDMQPGSQKSTAQKSTTAASTTAASPEPGTSAAAPPAARKGTAAGRPKQAGGTA